MKKKWSGTPWKLEEISGSYFIVGRGPLGQEYTVAEFFKNDLNPMELANARLIVRAVNAYVKRSPR